MTESVQADQDIPSIIQEPNDESKQTHKADDNVEEENDKASSTGDGILNGPFSAAENLDNLEVVSETAVVDEPSKSNDIAAKSTTDNLNAHCQAVADDAKVIEMLSVQPLINRTHKDSFVSEDGEESSTTEESSQSTDQICVIQFANAEENVTERVNVTVISTSRIETPEVHTSDKAEDEEPNTQESTSLEALSAGGQQTTTADVSQESKAGKNDSKDSQLPENEASLPSSSKQLSRTVSFTIEATTKITREASIKVHSEDVEIVSSTSSPLPNDQQQSDQTIEQSSSQQSVVNLDDIDDSQVIVNPETEEVSFRPRRRANSNTMQTIIRNPAIPEDKAIDDFSGEFQQRRPRHRISTLNRIRGSFSFGPKDRTLSRSSASFVDKSKNNFLSFHNIGYIVQQQKFCRRPQSQVILKNIR